MSVPPAGGPFRKLEPRQVAATHVIHAVRQVKELDDLARSRVEVSQLVWNAALEAQLLNVRAILDFLADAAPTPRKKGEPVDDITAHYFLPGWQGVAGADLRDRLDDYRQVVNKHIAHLTWTRVAALQEPDLNLDGMADDLLAAFSQFSTALTAANGIDARLFESVLL